MQTDQDYVRETLRDLVNRRGSLQVHLSGEGKLAFQSKGSSAWSGFVLTSINGDLGCMMPCSEKYDDCARTLAFNWLRQFQIVPHLNLGPNSELVLSDDEWEEELQYFDKWVGENLWKDRYVWQVMREGEDGVKEPVVTITLTPICNTYVTGVWTAADTNDYIGQLTVDNFSLILDPVDHTDLSKGVNWSADVTIDGQDYQLTDKNTVVFGDGIPEEGWHLLKDKSNDTYIVINEDDWRLY